MTDQQLQAIKERVAAATPGEWRVSLGLTEACPEEVMADQVCVATSYETDDAIFISYAKGDIEALVAEVERLRNEVHGHEQSLLHDTYSEFNARREIERLRKALEFYADKQDYTDLADAHITKMTDTKLGVDKGELARKALEGGK